MLQNPCKTLGFKKNMVYKIPPGGGGKPYPASGLYVLQFNTIEQNLTFKQNKINEVYVFSIKYRYSDILLIKHSL